MCKLSPALYLLHHKLMSLTLDPLFCFCGFYEFYFGSEGAVRVTHSSCRSSLRGVELQGAVASRHCAAICGEIRGRDLCCETHRLLMKEEDDEDLRTLESASVRLKISRRKNLDVFFFLLRRIFKKLFFM